MEKVNLLRIDFGESEESEGRRDFIFHCYDSLPERFARPFIDAILKAYLNLSERYGTTGSSDVKLAVQLRWIEEANEKHSQGGGEDATPEEVSG